MTIMQKYESPNVSSFRLETNNVILTGSNEGGGGNENYAPPFSNPFEDYNLNNFSGYPF